jgi:hypothetical protein
MLRDDARLLAISRERIRNIKSPRGIAGLRPEAGGGLWEGRELFEPDFERLSFEEKKRKFMGEPTLTSASWGTGVARPGQLDHAPFHAAGVPLLSWWKRQGHKVTANLGRGHARVGGREPKPSATVRFLACEFLNIARWYANNEWAENEDYENPLGHNLNRLQFIKMLQIGFKVAGRHNKNHTANR